MLGVHLKDLTFIEDGNQDKIYNLINFKKRGLLMDTIRILLEPQTVGYEFEILEPLYNFLKEVPFLDDKELYNISLSLEPKESKIKK